MQYFVIHSLDPYLLARFSMELQMEGWRFNIWFENDDPFKKYFNWLKIFPNKTFDFYNHSCYKIDTRFTLTESNYSQVLEEVVKSKL